MAHLIPAVKAKMGSTTYFEAVMPARELVSSVRPAKELDSWADWGIEERLQRELNMKRIESEMVPYLVKAPDRFFGSLIVLVYKGKISFEPLKDLVHNLPLAYRNVSQSMGFLTIEDGELIALDGQHRLVALREVVQGKVGADSEHASAVPNDEVSVIFIEYEDDQKTRRIFNKVNRHAKPTGRGDNIITSEDDGYAIVTRRLLADGAPLNIMGLDAAGKKKLLIEWQYNTLNARSPEFTTISAIYETVKDILHHEGVKDFDEKHRVTRPSEDELEHAFEHAATYWQAALDGISPYVEALKDTTVIPEMRKTSLLFKPAGQIVLFRAITRAIDRGLSLDEAVQRANVVDWTITNDIWRDVLVKANGQIIAREEAYDLAAELVAYLLAADKMGKDMVEKLRKAFNEARGIDIDNPQPGKVALELPKPVIAEAKSKKAVVKK